MKFEGKINSVFLRRALSERGSSLRTLAEQVVAGSVAMHQQGMKRRLRGRSTGSSNLRRQTGALARSLRPGVLSTTSGNVTGTSRIGLGAPYARIHEYGGTITAKKRFLTIPLRAARTNAKVTRESARLVREGKKWVTQNRLRGAADRDTFIYERRGRKFIGVERKGGGVLPVYMLRRRVTIKARLGFVATMRSQKAARERLYRRKVRRWLKGEL